MLVWILMEGIGQVGAIQGLSCGIRAGVVGKWRCYGKWRRVRRGTVELPPSGVSGYLELSFTTAKSRILGLFQIRPVLILVRLG